MSLRLVHITDIFHPHGDPDDHYDLALVFALHQLGHLELHRVLMDYPPPHRAGDPALCAAAQLNAITGCEVPYSVTPENPQAAGQVILSILRQSDRPVAFSVVGDCTALATAIQMDAALFSKNCAGIYLAAGTGVETPGGELEYNVRLRPAAFAAIFTAPCPIYWAPCYHTILPGLKEQGGEYGSVYCMQQKALLNHLSPVMQKYFLYMLTRSTDPKYLRYLREPVDAAALSQHGETLRRLWSTPLLLHAGGIPCATFTFTPVQVNAAPDGHLQWQECSQSNIQLFHQLCQDRETSDSFDTSGSYRAEMLDKLKTILGAIQ